MPDIAMCKGQDCPLKENCYRYTANPCEYQSYFLHPPHKDGKCEHFWDNKVYRKIEDYHNKKI